MAARNDPLNSIFIALGHVALVIISLFIVADAAGKAGESEAVAHSAVIEAQAATARADLAEREGRLAQSKIESLRNEVSELRGMVLGKPKEK